MNIGKPDIEREFEVTPLEEPLPGVVPEPAPAEEPVPEPTAE
jgi:hypothetical protein